MNQLLTRPNIQARVAVIDGLRAFAALYVMIYHIKLYTIDISYLPYPSFLNFFNYGHQGVCLFIILSGFCLMSPVVKHGMNLNGGVKYFLIRRSIRIIPTYYAAILFSLLVWLLQFQLTGEKNPWTLKELVGNLLMFPDVQKWTHINGAFWSLAVEWRIYFCFPILIYLWRKTHWGIALLFSLLVTILGTAFVPLTGFVHIVVWHFLILFFFGMFVAYAAFQLPKSKILCWLSLLLGLAGLIGILPSISGMDGHIGSGLFNIVIGDLWIGLYISLIMYHLVTIESLPTWLLSRAPLVRIGEYSYSLYLLHSPILLLLSSLLPQHNGLNSFVALASTIPCVLFFSYHFSLIAERPFARMRQLPQLNQIFEKTHQIFVNGTASAVK